MSMTQKDLFRLRHMLDAARNAREFAGADKAEFEGSKLRQYAAIRALTILGEAAKVVHPATRERWPEFPWREMTGMRDVLTHEYFGVELKIVWAVVSEELVPVLKMLPEIISAVEEHVKTSEGSEG